MSCEFEVTILFLFDLIQYIFIVFIVRKQLYNEAALWNRFLYVWLYTATIRFHAELALCTCFSLGIGVYACLGII